MPKGSTSRNIILGLVHLLWFIKLSNNNIGVLRWFRSNIGLFQERNVQNGHMTFYIIMIPLARFVGIKREAQANNLLEFGLKDRWVGITKPY